MQLANFINKLLCKTNSKAAEPFSSTIKQLVASFDNVGINSNKGK